MTDSSGAMTPEEFAMLSGAMPDAPLNPTPAYGGYMDNGGFGWVSQQDDFPFSAETFRATVFCPQCDGVAYDESTMLDLYWACSPCDIAWYDGGEDKPITMAELRWIQNNPMAHYGVSKEDVEDVYGKEKADTMGAESRFDKLANKIASQYE